MLSIRAAAKICRQKLQECASQAPLQEGHWAANRSSDFNLWISGVGACANESNSLDKRLESDTSARKVIIGTLTTLAAWTTKCEELARGTNFTTITNKQDIQDITLDEAKNAVEALLKTLVDLELAIRRAGTASRMRRADRTFHKRKNDYQDVSETLKSTLRVFGPFLDEDDPTTQPPAPAGIDKKTAKTGQINVKSRLDQLQGENIPLRPEQQIILHANIKRHHRFEFYKSRQKQLETEQTQEPAQAPQIRVRSFHAKSLNSQRKNEQKAVQSSHSFTDKEAAPARSQHSTGTTNKASDYKPNLVLEKPIENVAPSVVATTFARHADYPKPPRDKTRCPYCLIPLNGAADNAQQWKKHVSEDLQPYTCHLPGCTQNNPFFNTFSSWRTHLFSNEHQKFEGWTCLFCRFSSEPTEESSFREHVQNDHSDAVATQFLNSFTKMCCRHTVPALDRCPVCSTYENHWKLQKDNYPKPERKAKSFLEHIGQCLHDFALTVLPNTELTDSVDDASQNLSAISQITDQSLLSCSLHISNHEDAGLTKTDLERALGLKPYDKVDKSKKIQAWLGFLDKMDDPNSLEQTKILNSQAKEDTSMLTSMNNLASIQVIYTEAEYSRHPTIALQTIVLMSDEQKGQMLLDKEANIITQEGNQSREASKSYQDIVQILLAKGADGDAQCGDWGYLLHAVSSQGDQDVVQLLLEHGADTNAQGERYGTALQAASSKGYQDTVQLLLDKGADINVLGGRYNSALQAASAKGYQDIVQLLLDRGAEINAPNAPRGRYSSPLQAASHNGYLDIVQLLLDKGAFVNALGGHYNNALQAASAKGYLNIVQLLLDNGAYIDELGGRYSSPLQAASYNGYQDIVQLLLDKGADINALGGRYGSALQAASYIGYKDIVQLLVEKGADINALVGRYGSALQTASYQGYKDIVQLLLSAGADPNARSQWYGTALQIASSSSHQDIVQLLLKYGATKSSNEKTDKTGRQEQRAEGDQAVTEIIDDSDSKGKFSREVKTEHEKIPP